MAESDPSQGPRDNRTAATGKMTSATTSSSAAPLPTSDLRRRPVAESERSKSPEMDSIRPLSGRPSGAIDLHVGVIPWARKNQWIVLAVASGACAAINGVFAKLTTNNLTTHIAQGLATTLHLAGIQGVIEFVVRCIFFGLNLAFNGIMWALFTKALARGSSTTQVSIMNTSSNFMITALLGFAIFSEALPPLWWLGAALLVAGNVIIGRKDGESSSVGEEGEDAISVAESGASVPDRVVGLQQPVVPLIPVEKDDDEDADEDVALLGDLSSPSRS